MKQETLFEKVKREREARPSFDSLTDLKCVKCGGQDFSTQDFAVLPILVELPQIVSLPFGAMYKITGLELNTGDVLCPKCFHDIANHTEPTIRLEEYCDVECDVCQNKYSRSMGTFSWEGWCCATNFCPQRQEFYPGCGSCYDDDVFSVLCLNKLKENWKNIDLSKEFIICDTCLTDGLDKQFLEHKTQPDPEF